MAGLILFFAMSGVVILPVMATDTGEEKLHSGPDVAIIDATARLDISDIGDIPLGTVVDERLILTITVKNVGNREAPGYKLKSFLVRVGREDEIGTQIGGDITDIRLGAGETRTYTRTAMIPSHLKKGQYRVMVVLDTSNYFIEPETDNNRLLSPDTLSPGSSMAPTGSIPVYSPVSIEEPGYYLLKRNIDGGNKVNIFEIKSSGVTFDGGGNTIRGVASGYATGIYINAGSAVRDIVIKNLVIEDVDAGIWMYKASNGKIENCIFRNMKNMGLRLDQSHQNDITGNTFEYNTMGIGVFESNSNIIYNNLFKNKHNAVVNENQKNKWNTNLKSGTNIIGGSQIGGNAWFDETGEGGFSTTAQDYTHDGISDAPYSLNPSNIDLYPLTISPGKSATTPEPAKAPEETESGIIQEEQEESNDMPVALENITESDLTHVIEPETLDIKPTELPEEIKSEPVQVAETATTSIQETPEITLEPTDEPTLEEISDDESSHAIISPYADISIKEITGPESGCPGSEYTLSAVIENTGGYDADMFQARFYLSEDRQIDSRDITLGEKTITNLQSGTEQTIDLIFSIPELIGLKNYYLVIIANTDNGVFEDKKSNNTGYSSTRMRIREC